MVGSAVSSHTQQRLLWFLQADRKSGSVIYFVHVSPLWWLCPQWWKTMGLPLWESLFCLSHIFFLLRDLICDWIKRFSIGLAHQVFFTCLDFNAHFCPFHRSKPLDLRSICSKSVPISGGILCHLCQRKVFCSSSGHVKYISLTSIRREWQSAKRM